MSQTKHNNVHSLPQYSVFKIKHRMDFGMLNKTLVLDNLNVKSAADQLTKALTMNGFNLLCATKNMDTVPCLKQFENYGDITADVAGPGDVLVFKAGDDKTDLTFEKALRKAS